MRITLANIFFILLTLNYLHAQQKTQPAIFAMGEDEQLYEELKNEYAYSLLNACDENMEKAFINWIKMVKALEDYADSQSIDIKGVRAWMHVFFSENGQVDHIGFILKPDSRNIDQETFVVLLKEFAKNYTFPVKFKRKFSHYTGVTFPTFSEVEQKK